MRAPEDRLFEQYRRRHDARLLAKVFDRTAPALLRIARHAAPRRDLADDLLQQTFLAAIEGADRWTPERGLFPWLVGILVRQARLLHREEGREPILERLGTGLQQPQPGQAAEARELEQAIAAAVAELGDTYRPVLHLHLFHGLNAKEIAAALDRPAGSVRTQLVRGLGRLRSALPVGLAAGAITLAPVLASVRGRVLRHVAEGATPLAVPGLSTPLLLLGGSTMKKGWLATAALLLVALVTVPLLTTTRPASEASPSGSVAARNADAGLEAGDTSSRPAAAAALDGPEVGPRVPADRRALAPTGATLRVRVVVGSTAEERPLPGVWVYLHDDRSRRPGQAEIGGRTDAEGRVAFDDVPTKPWKVTAMTGAEDARQWITPEPGAVHDVVLRSRSAQFVDVEVVDGNGQPVADAEVWAGIQIGGPRPPLRTSTRQGGRTDAKGHTHIAVGRGEVVSARKPGYAASPASPVALESHEAISLVLGDGPGTLHGVVTFEDGTPASAATVRVFPATPPEARRLTTHRDDQGRLGSPPLAVLRPVDPEGRFEIGGLAPGTYRVWTDASTLLYEGVLVTVAAGQVRDVRLTLPRRAWVTGRVVRSDGSPAAGVFLGIRRPTDERTLLSDVVDPDGHFTFMVPAGRMRLEVWRGAGEPLAEAETLATLDPEPLELVVRDPLSAAGRLTLENGEPVVDWIVGALARGVTVNRETVAEALVSGRFARSADDGSFAIHGAGEGPFTVFASPVRRAVTGPAPLTRTNVAAGTRGLELTVPPGLLEVSRVTVRVLDEGGAPIPGTEVLLRTGGETFELRQRDGAFVHDRLVQSDYVLEAQAPDHAGQALPVTLDTLSLDLGTLALSRSVPVTVTPRLGEGPWQGRLPQPVVHDRHSGTPLSPQPIRRDAVDGTLLLDGLPPGSYELRPSPDDDLLSVPLPFELTLGKPQHLDWPVRIGRALTLRFAADPAARPDERLHVTVRDEAQEVVLRRQLAPTAQGTVFSLPHEFLPGRYTVEALLGTSFSWTGSFDTSAGPQGGTVDVLRAR